MTHGLVWWVCRVHTYSLCTCNGKWTAKKSSSHCLYINLSSWQGAFGIGICLNATVYEYQNMVYTIQKCNMLMCSFFHILLLYFFLSFSLLNIFLLPGIIWNFTLFHFYVYFVILLMIIKHNINSIIPLLLCNPIMEKFCGFIIRVHCIVFFSFSCAFFIQSFFAPNGGRGGNYEILNSEI